MNLKTEAERLETEIESIFESRNESLIGDGIISYENYLNAKYRILWVLKEPYDGFDERGNPVGGGWHFRQAFLPKKRKSDFDRRSLATYDPMLYITYSIQIGRAHV